VLNELYFFNSETFFYDLFRKAAIELNRKSQMVSEAVEEVLSLVDKATAAFKEIAGDDVITLFDGELWGYFGME